MQVQNLVTAPAQANNTPSAVQQKNSAIEILPVEAKASAKSAIVSPEKTVNGASSIAKNSLLAQDTIGALIRAQVSAGANAQAAANVQASAVSANDNKPAKQSFGAETAQYNKIATLVPQTPSSQVPRGGQNAQVVGGGAGSQTGLEVSQIVADEMPKPLDPAAMTELEKPAVESIEVVA